MNKADSAARAVSAGDDDQARWIVMPAYPDLSPEPLPRTPVLRLVASDDEPVPAFRADPDARSGGGR